MAPRNPLPVDMAHLTPYTVATVPPAGQFKDHMIYVNNGAAGDPCLAVSDGTNWVRMDTPASAISAS